MEKLPFYYRMIRGAVGKQFVIKHYKGGRIAKTRYPDMSGIVATEKQKVRRDLFREAVVWAKWIIADEERKLAFGNTLPRKKRKKVYQAALQMYMKEKGNKQWVSKQVMVCNGQLAMGYGDARKQLALMAVIESRRVEVMDIKGGYEQMGHWGVMWEKKIENEASSTNCYSPASQIRWKVPAVL